MNESTTGAERPPNTSNVETPNPPKNPWTGTGGPTSKSWSVDPTNDVSNESNYSPAPSTVRYNGAKYNTTWNPAIVGPDYGNKTRCGSNGKSKTGPPLPSKSGAKNHPVTNKVHTHGRNWVALWDTGNRDRSGNVDRGSNSGRVTRTNGYNCRNNGVTTLQTSGEKRMNRLAHVVVRKNSSPVRLVSMMEKRVGNPVYRTYPPPTTNGEGEETNVSLGSCGRRHCVKYPCPVAVRKESGTRKVRYPLRPKREPVVRKPGPLPPETSEKYKPILSPPPTP